MQARKCRLHAGEQNPRAAAAAPARWRRRQPTRCPEHVAALMKCLWHMCRPYDYPSVTGGTAGGAGQGGKQAKGKQGWLSQCSALLVQPLAAVSCA